MHRKVDYLTQKVMFRLQEVEIILCQCSAWELELQYHQVRPKILMGISHCVHQAYSIQQERDYDRDIKGLNLQNRCSPCCQIQALFCVLIVLLFVLFHFVILQVLRQIAYRCIICLSLLFLFFFGKG